MSHSDHDSATSPFSDEQTGELSEQGAAAAAVEEGGLVVVQVQVRLWAQVQAPAPARIQVQVRVRVHVRAQVRVQGDFVRMRSA
jgi:hypothetical protein